MCYVGQHQRVDGSICGAVRAGWFSVSVGPSRVACVSVCVFARNKSNLNCIVHCNSCFCGLQSVLSLSFQIEQNTRARFSVHFACAQFRTHIIKEFACNSVQAKPPTPIHALFSLALSLSRPFVQIQIRLCHKMVLEHIHAFAHSHTSAHFRVHFCVVI